MTDIPLRPSACSIAASELGLYLNESSSMNQDEATAEKYLNTCGRIVFEPDGNIPPDFSINGKIGVEVRRLNQNYRETGKVSGLEQNSIPLIKTVEAVLSKYPVVDPNERFRLSIRYGQNTSKKREIEKSIDSAIQSFETSGHQYPSTYSITDTLELVFAAKAGNTNQKYSLGIFLDRNRGGWVVDIYTTEINHCAQEKEKKVKPYQNAYSEWWLILVDHLCAFDSYSHKDILAGIEKPSVFEKIILMNSQSKKILEI